jgi:hypothetical protein
MRSLLAMTLLAAIFVAPVVAANDFPSHKVHDEDPFNRERVITGGAISCPTTYQNSQFITDKTKIAAEVKACVASSFGIQKDIGLDFGELGTDYARCIVPKTYEARPPSNNPMWPLCCPTKLPDGKYRMTCRVFFTSK